MLKDDIFKIKPFGVVSTHVHLNKRNCGSVDYDNGNLKLESIPGDLKLPEVHTSRSRDQSEDS